MDVVLHLDLTIIFEARLCNDSSLSMSRVGKINDLYMYSDILSKAP